MISPHEMQERMQMLFKLFSRNVSLKRELLLTIFLLVGANAAVAQNDSRNVYPIQEYRGTGNWAAAAKALGFEGVSMLFGQSLQSVCNQFEAQLVASYDLINANNANSGDGVSRAIWEISPVEVLFLEINYSWYCHAHRDVRVIDPPHPEVTHDVGTVSGLVSPLCQKSDSSPVPIELTHIYSTPSFDRIAQQCFCNAPATFDEGAQWCYEPVVEEIPPEKNCEGGQENSTDRPCNVATGNKHRSEPDVTSGAFTFTRYYNSKELSNLGVGRGWRGSYDKFLDLRFNDITVARPGGRAESFRRVNDQWVGDDDTDIDLVVSINGPRREHRSYELRFQDGRVETYNFRGFLVKEVDSKGNELTIHNAFGASGYSFRRFTNQYGQRLQLHYSEGLLTRVNDSNNVNYLYEYDEHQNLVAVIYPDLTTDDDTDNPRKIYHYENPDFPNHLTGITDENGDRYATFSYDEDGKAISSELGQTGNTTGQERVDLDYQGAQ